MPKDQLLELLGAVSEVLPNAMFRVRLEGDREVVAALAETVHGTLPPITTGDKVLVEVKPYDLAKGRIVLRIS